MKAICAGTKEGKSLTQLCGQQVLTALCYASKPQRSEEKFISNDEYWSMSWTMLPGKGTEQLKKQVNLVLLLLRVAICPIQV